ncbi:MAG: glycosyltransferase family 39 protein, partial [Gaiellaceae bacterium]
MGTLVLVAGTAAVALTGGLVAACLRMRATVSFLLAAYLLASAEIVGVSLLLSTGRRLERDVLVVVIGALLAVALACWIRLGRPAPPLPAHGRVTLRALVRDPVVATLGVLAVVTHAYLLAVALTVPQGVGDALLYHLPRAALWKQQHGVAYVNHAPDERVNTFPPNAEIESMASMILSGGDRYVSLVQVLALGVICVAIFGIARRIGFDRRQAVFAALLFSTFTVVVLQTPTALNDLVVASLLSACAYFALGASRNELVLAALALGLALGTKLTAVFALPALALFALAGQPRRRWVSLALFGAAGAVAGSYWLGVNLAETGRLDGGVALDPGAD